MKKCAFLLALLCPALGYSKPLVVVSLSTVLTDIAKEIGGDSVEVTGLVKPGVDPHEFEPTPEDVKAVSQADLVLASGKGMEGYLSKLEQTADSKKFLEVGRAFPSLEMKPEEGQAHGKDERVEDPHWWHSIENVKKAATVVRNALIERAPEHKDYFLARAVEYRKRLESLEKWARLEMAALPRNKRKLVTSHDAFQYFARDWGFAIYPIEGISTEDQPSSQKVAALIALIRAQRVKAVFAENIENPKVLREITRETGATLGGTLYADGLGDGDASTYEGMMRHNISTIVTALR